MSAAAPPPPPPHRIPVPASNGYHTRRESANNAGAFTPPYPTYDSDGPPAGQRKPFPHLQDLVARSNNRVDPNASIDKLLESAQRLLKQAQSSLEFAHPDQAYTEYLAAFNIIAYTVPRHRDALMLHDRQNLARANRALVREIGALEARFRDIHDIIQEDNRRSGVTATISGSRPQSALPDAHRILPERSSNLGRTLNEPPLSRSDNASSYAVGLQRPVESAMSPPEVSRYKPPVQPKPQNLHGTAISGQTQRTSAASNSTTDALSARFAQLRTGSSLAKNVSNVEDSDTDGFGENVFRLPQSSKHDPPTLQLKTNGLSSNLLDSKNTERYAFADNGLNKDLPKLPSPTYSPGRGNGTPIQPPRSIRNSLLNNGGNVSSVPSPISLATIAESAPGRSNGSVSAEPQQLAAVNVGRPEQAPRRKSMHMPMESEITAETLYDYLKIYNILLIDVRSRDEYDAGHIFTLNGMCIEPAALRENMSAEELHEALVVSPDNEETLFDRRDQFDLVVYYDQSSTSTGFQQSNRTRKSNASLKYLHDALYEFNQEKPLQYPPVFLIGGIEAWVDLQGEQALKISNTAARAKAAKAGRPIARRPPASVTGKLNVQKRRLRDYNPLAPEEEEKWRERARSESFILDSQPQVEDAADENEDQLETYARDYDEFWRRFPDVATVERQSMTTPTPRISEYQQPPPSYTAPPPPRYQPPPVPASPSRPLPIAQRPSYSGVSERSASQTLPNPKASHLLPYIPPKLKRLPRTGLHNFGATCYMNATIQCLSATVPLTAFFLDGRFDKYVQKDNWKGSKGIMPELYTNLLRNLWQPNGVDTIRPSNFRKLCARLNKEWASDRQQDAKEFLEFLVDVLHEDLNVNWNRTPLRQLTPAEEDQRERTHPFIASMKEWSRYEHRDHSRLTDLFAGQYISRLQCTTCRRNSTTYEAFYSISVEIPPTTSKSTASVTLDDCLRSYCAAEMLSGEDVWRCPHCNASREATKRITITRAPEFLIIHLKRFSASHAQSARKVHTPVEFPLQNLDLEPYMLPALAAAERDDIVGKFGEEPLRDTPRAMQRPFKYDAYAVMRHLGASMGSGHYIGIVRDAARGCWREFDDEKIGDFRPEELPWERRLQNGMAYIVFYQRVLA